MVFLECFGSWAEKDVDPALFSRELMADASSLVEDEEVNYNPRNLIRKAYAVTSTIGSATVAVAMLERNGTLKIDSVGDCGVKVIRKGRVAFSTSPQIQKIRNPTKEMSNVFSILYSV